MASGSYWCYSCSRFVWVSDPDFIACPDCDGGFVEQIQDPPDFTRADSFHPRQRHSHRRSANRFPLSAMYSAAADVVENSPRSAVVRSRSQRSPNPVIVLRGSGQSDESEGPDRSAFQMYYDDGTESGLRPLPPSMTEFLLGSGFDRLLDQISQIELNANRNNRSWEHPPASKSAIESLPVIEIEPTHLESDSQSHCAVCKETFVLNSAAREMPCNHIYHPDCILPWLALRNSCPVCRHELPAEEIGTEGGGVEGATATATATTQEEEDDESASGLTIWRLPGGGFAVGRIPGGRRGGDRMMPVVYTEVDGGRFADDRLPRRVSWGSRGGRGGGRERGSGFAGRVMRLFGCFSGSGSGSRSRENRPTRSFALFNNTTSSSRRRWVA
ncbi:PREDICTED: probable E3 ubiquitin-protein ligase RHC2A [Tarenaya hassleriana]|uniref:probable E3 ubiquitin-protein ligase RHC2A n=1 Tax=Tarenaya hassleriana TaxID=28532 RepID=UPI00053C53AA|nr:PREDICTED: probable E3 ubiquitin-protein ligase RHC2A [Tarenaya hassleriana]